MSLDLVRRALAFTNGPLDVSDEELAEVFAPDVVLDMSARVFNPQVYEGYEGLRQFRTDAREVWETLKISEAELIEEGDRILVQLQDPLGHVGGAARLVSPLRQQGSQRLAAHPLERRRSRDECWWQQDPRWSSRRPGRGTTASPTCEARRRSCGRAR